MFDGEYCPELTAGLTMTETCSRPGSGSLWTVHRFGAVFICRDTGPGSVMADKGAGIVICLTLSGRLGTPSDYQLSTSSFLQNSLAPLMLLPSPVKVARGEYMITSQSSEMDPAREPHIQQILKGVF